jgi:uncharacterized protein (TIGR03083 family)
VDERNAIIEAAAGRSAAWPRAALAEQTTQLESVWADISGLDWSRPVRFRNADIGATVFARWREVWIHMVDLDLGVGPDDWPMDLAIHAIDFLRTRLPEGTSLRARMPSAVVYSRRAPNRDHRPCAGHGGMASRTHTCGTANSTERVACPRALAVSAA